MKKTIHQIRQQPFQTRETIMWVSVALVFSAFSFFWVMNFQGDTFALLNPGEVTEKDTAVAEGERKKASPFAAILTTLVDLKEGIQNFGGSDLNEEEELRSPNTLPLTK